MNIVLRQWLVLFSVLASSAFCCEDQWSKQTNNDSMVAPKAFAAKQRILRKIDPALERSFSQQSAIIDYFGMAYWHQHGAQPKKAEDQLELSLYTTLLQKLRKEKNIFLRTTIVELLQRINRELMTDPRRSDIGMEGTPAYQIGEWRRYQATTALESSVTAEHPNNPLLSVDSNGRVHYFDLDRTEEHIAWAIEDVLPLNLSRQWKQKWLSRFRSLKPDAGRRLESSRNREVSEFRQEFIAELVTKSVAWARGCHRSQRESCTSMLSYFLMSIHPFSNGNGRTLRLFHRLALGVEEPLLVRDIHEDIFHPLDTWVQTVNLARFRTEYTLHDAFLRALLHREQIPIFARESKRLTQLESQRLKQLQQRKRALFQAHVLERMLGGKSFDPRLREYIDAPDEIYLGATQGFIDSLLRRSRSQQEYDNKMQMYYVPLANEALPKKDTAVEFSSPYLYRGFGLSGDEPLSDAELLENFWKIGWVQTGEGLTPSSRSIAPYFRKLEDAIEDSYDDILTTKVLDHVQVTSGYSKSGLISYSTDLTVSDAFTWPAMPGSKHRALICVRNRMQASLATAYWLSEEWNYSDENEVVHLGWTDPESMVSMIYQSTDAQTRRKEYRILRRLDFETVEIESFDDKFNLQSRRQVKLPKVKVSR